MEFRDIESCKNAKVMKMEPFFPVPPLPTSNIDAVCCFAMMRFTAPAAFHKSGKDQSMHLFPLSVPRVENFACRAFACLKKTKTKTNR